MPATHRLDVVLTDDFARLVRAKVASGQYASDSAVIEDGLRALQEEDRHRDGDPELERFLIEVVGPTYDLMKADPSRGLMIDEVRASLAALHERTVRQTHP